MITKACSLAVAMVLVTLAAPRSAADTKSDECGLASVYGSVSEETASGEDTLAADFTAAHRSLPFGTLVTVYNQENGRSAMVRITDRGPFVDGRIIDVYPVHVMTRKSFGLMTRKLSVTELQRSARIPREPFHARKLSVASANWGTSCVALVVSDVSVHEAP